MRRAPVGSRSLDVLELVASELFDDIGGSVPIGTGVPGLVDRNGVLRFAPNLPRLSGTAIRAELERRLGVSVVVDNDATCATWGEWRAGGGAGGGDLVFLTLGTGIGAGFVLGGRLHRGANGFAGEPGHMVVAADGWPCPCGKRGCWERYAAGSAIPTLALDEDLVVGSGEEVTAMARAGDAVARRVVDRYAWWLAVGIGSLIDVLDVATVVLGGGVVEDGDLLLEPLRRHLRTTVMAADHRPEVDVRLATLGAEAGAIGAALMAVDG